MNILVTGAAGFIGGNFCKYLIDNHPSDKVIALDALTYAGHIETIKAIKDDKQFLFIEADIRDKDKINQVFKEHNIDIVVNFAAESHVDRSITNPDVFLTTNIIGTQVLMEASLKYNVQRFHQVSTDEVYGDLPLDRPDLKFTEQTPLHTSSPYSASKAAADLLVGAYHRTFNLPVTISRCSNNYGPYQYPEKLIPLMIMNASRNKKLPVYGKGLNIRDWLYVEDHCEAIDLIIREGQVGEVYNIGGDTEKTNIDVVQSILHILNKPESLIEYVEDRKGHDLRYAIDASKLNMSLSWKPKYDFDKGLKKTIDWYEDNKDWLNKVMKKDSTLS